MEADELPRFPCSAYALANLRRYCEALELDYGALAPLARMQLASMPPPHLHERVLLNPPPARSHASPGVQRSGAAGTLLAGVSLTVFLFISAVTAMHIASVEPAEPVRITAQPPPPYLEWEEYPLVARSALRRDSGGAE
jgi:hypothetical protein